jgi:hypothetical protein
MNTPKKSISQQLENVNTLGDLQTLMQNNSLVDFSNYADKIFSNAIKNNHGAIVKWILEKYPEIDVESCKTYADLADNNDCQPLMKFSISLLSFTN